MTEDFSEAVSLELKAPGAAHVHIGWALLHWQGDVADDNLGAPFARWAPGLWLVLHKCNLAQNVPNAQNVCCHVANLNIRLS